MPKALSEVEVKTIKISKSETQTQKLGETLGKSLKAGDIVALYGDLGAGKTVFVKGIAKGLGIKKRILSPTFVFIRSYPLTGEKQFYHVDLYRGQSLEDFEALGLEELFSKNNIVVLEWAGKIAKILPQKRIDINIEKVEDTERSRSKDENTRKITITSPVIASAAKQSHNESSSYKRSYIVRAKSRTSSSVILNSFQDLKKVVDPEQSRRAASILKSGGVVIFPTDTVYGIGCRYDDKDALDRIYKIKSRPKDVLFPILVSSVKQVERLAIITPSARELIEKYWPGGLTIILSTRHPEQCHPELDSGSVIVSGLNQKIGFRMPDHQEILSMIDLVGVPIIGTSANFHGQSSAASFEDLDPKLIKLADFVIKGTCRKGVESTVVDATANHLKILRQGAVTLR
ncbi:MAG: L-threonylcarbamoyladenylate synthase [Candidatus Curtissbacteria bacterium]|nr:L-threonylcarbamoyladenylate synthase [Candidatus Curtissbacteria bacterium]